MNNITYTHKVTIIQCRIVERIVLLVYTAKDHDIFYKSKYH